MRTPRAALRVAALAAVGGLVLAACGGGGSSSKTSSTTAAGSGTKTYTIAYVGPLTGDAGNLGLNIVNGVKVAVDDANKAGKVKIDLKQFDTQGDPAQAQTVKDRYINDKTILGIVGPAFSGETKAVLPALSDAGLVMVSPSATNVQLPDVVPGNKVFHRVLADDNAQAAGLAKYLQSEVKPKTMAIVHDNSEYGKGLAVDQLKPLVEKNGIQVVVTDAVDPKSQDFSAVVNKVKAANPEVVFYGGYYQEAGRLKKQLADASVKAVFLSGDGSLDPGFVDAAGSQAEGAQLSCPCNLATVDSAGKLGEFAKAYKALNGKDPGTYSAEGYDAAMILIKGLEGGNTSRPKLLEYVETLPSYEGISKTIDFQPNGNIKAQGVFLFQVKGGKIIPLVATDEL